MIRFSALLTAAAMVLLVVGVSAANLGLIYLSIAVSILAAVTLAVGVLLRRREIFGEAGAPPESARPGRAAADAERARPVPVRPAIGARADRRGRPEVRQGDGGQQGDLAARLRKAMPGAVADGGSGRWPGAIAAKAAPGTARGGDHSGHAASRGRAASPPSGRGPVARDQGAREPARGDWAGRDRAERDRADRDPAERDREPARSGRDRDQATARPDREHAGRGDRDGERGRDRDREPAPDRDSGRDRGGARGRDAAARADRARAAPGERRDRRAAARGDSEPARDRDGARGRDAAARPDRARAAPGERRDRERVARGERDRAPGQRRDRDAAAQRDREQAAPGQRPDRETAPRGDREHAGHGRDRDQAAADQQAEAFRLPPPGERARARAEALSRGLSGESPGDDFWDRVSEELAGSGDHEPVRPAWSATAGPRAMGAGPAATHAPGETGDEPGPARSPAGRSEPERTPRDRGAIPRPSGPPGEEQDRDEQPDDASAEPGWDRVVPRYVDDLARRGGQQREPEGERTGADKSAVAGEPDGTWEDGGTAGSGNTPADDGARAGATAGAAGRDAGSVWSAWSGTPHAARTGGRDAVDAGGDGLDQAEEAERGVTESATAEGAARASTAAAAAPGGGTGADETGADEARADVTRVPEAAAAVSESGEPTDAAAVGADAAADRDESVGPVEAAGPPGDQRPGGTEGRDDADGRAGTDGPVKAPGSTAKTGSTRGTGDAGEADDTAESDADGAAPLDHEVTVVPGVARYHRRGCILIRFLSDGDLEITTRREAEAAGSVPCKACQPDKPASTG